MEDGFSLEMECILIEMPQIEKRAMECFTCELPENGVNALQTNKQMMLIIKGLINVLFKYETLLLLLLLF